MLFSQGCFASHGVATFVPIPRHLPPQAVSQNKSGLGAFSGDVTVRSVQHATCCGGWFVLHWRGCSQRSPSHPENTQCIPQRFPKDWCSQGTGLGPWILDPGWGCSAFRRCAVKGQWIPERNKKTPGVLEMCGGEGGAGPSQRQCKGQHGEGEAPAVDFLHFTRGGGGPGSEPAIRASQRSATH